MRPARIRLAGFSAYRNPTELNLEGLELFSLSGATGAGKSSLIDAMIFALYGRIPRLGGRAVAPVISVGADRAKVAFDFEVGDVRYTVSRVAERTKNGATVREARLERHQAVPVASGADEVTRAVEELLSLRFDDFTKTVVLPQGEFARFLNAGSTDRRELLRDLLGLSIYTRVRELAGIRRSVASDRASSARNRLDDLEVADEATIGKAEERLAALERLSQSMPERQGRLDRINAELEKKRLDASHIGEALERLVVIAPPEHLDQLDQLVSEAEQEAAAAGEIVERAAEEIADLETRISGLPSPERITALRDTHNKLATVEERLAVLDVVEAREQVAEAEKVFGLAQADLDEAREALIRARTSHAAHAVAQTLVLGQPCPVCRQEVTEIPESETQVKLAGLEKAEAARRTEAESARASVETTRAALTALETRRAELEAQRKELATELGDEPGPEELEARAAELAALSAKLEMARRQLETAQADLSKARKQTEDLAETLRSVGLSLIRSLHSVANLDPPVPESDDPIVQWKEVMQWRDAEIDRQSEVRAGALAEVETLALKAEDLRGALLGELEELGVSVEEPLVAQVVRELEAARHVVERYREAARQKRQLEEELAKAETEEKVAAALAGHLRADGFERWLMSGAISGLVAGANHLLSQLSSGGYSLRSDSDGAFAIVDHHNADEVRPVSTLSGGETFLVSLSLALSLAETLSSAGGARLDAIILDEGFGTLDEESLDTVATVLEELAGRGLMVGVITHVKELAARAPSRFEVIRGPTGSAVVAIP